VAAVAVTIGIRTSEERLIAFSKEFAMLKKIIIVLAMILFAIQSDVQAYGYGRSRGIAKVKPAFGLSYGGVLGHGKAENIYKPGRGLWMELCGNFHQFDRFIWVIWGYSAYWTKNEVGSSSMGARGVTPYYTDFRFYSRGEKFTYYGAVGFAWSRMYIQEMKGSDNLYCPTYGVGASLRLREDKPATLNASFKWFIALGNSLGQKLGAEVRFGIAF
jgi:hypothetical protein